MKIYSFAIFSVLGLLYAGVGLAADTTSGSAISAARAAFSDIEQQVIRN
jgi:hypothetical protein